MQQIFQNLSPWCYTLFDLLVLIVASRRFSGTLWGRLLITGAAVSLCTGLFWRIAPYLLRDGRGAGSFYANAQGFVGSFNIWADALVLLGIASIPFGRRAVSALPVGSVASEGAPRNPWLLILLLPITINIYWLAWLHRAVRELKPVAPDLIDFTPGRAVGFLFIPFFNFYWLYRVWFRLTKAIGRLQALSPQSATSSPESVFAGGCVIVLLTLGFVFNSLARLEPWSLLLGELFFVTTIVYTQVTLNRAWRTALVLPPVPAAPPLVMAT